MSLTPIIPSPDDLKRTMGTMAPQLGNLRAPDAGPPGGLPSLGALPPLPSGGPPAMPGKLQPIVTNPRQQQEQALQDKINQKPQGFWQNLRHIAGIAGTVAGDIVAPGETKLVEQDLGKVGIGPDANQVRQRQLAGLQAGDVSMQDAASKRGLEGAQGDYYKAHAESLPVTAQIGRDKIAANVAEHGLMMDEDGNLIPDKNSPVYEKQQSAIQLADATTELHQAQTEFEKTRSDPNSPQYQQAAQRLQIAKMTQDRLLAGVGAMQERAKASLMNATREAQGTDLAGNPLPGAMLTDSGQPVGSSQAVNVRPTGTQRSKGNMAESADQQINDMKSIVEKRSDIFGPAAGRTTDFSVWLGSQDPDAQRFRAARTIAGDHLAGTFGGRSEAALQALDSAIGHFKDNPAAVTAGLNQLQEANRLFLKAGQVHTVGGGGAQPAAGGGTAGAATHKWNPETGQIEEIKK